MNIRDQDKEWLINISLNKLFRWKMQGTQSLYKQVLVTNLLLETGFPKFYLFGNPDCPVNQDKTLFPNGSNLQENTQQILNDDEHNMDITADEGTTGLVSQQETNIGTTIAHINPTTHDKRIVIDQLLETLMQDVVQQACNNRSKPLISTNPTSDIVTLTPFKSGYHKEFHE